MIYLYYPTCIPSKSDVLQAPIAPMTPMRAHKDSTAYDDGRRHRQYPLKNEQRINNEEEASQELRSVKFFS